MINKDVYVVLYSDHKTIKQLYMCNPIGNDHKGNVLWRQFSDCNSYKLVYRLSSKTAIYDIIPTTENAFHQFVPLFSTYNNIKNDL